MKQLSRLATALAMAGILGLSAVSAETRVAYCKSPMEKSPHDIPADLYYVCFNGDFDWDADKNGIRGEGE